MLKGLRALSMEPRRWRDLRYATTGSGEPRRWRDLRYATTGSREEN
jgi:hypothetical protein